MAGFGETIREFGVKLSLQFDKKGFEAAGEKVEKISSNLRHFSFEIAGAATAFLGFAALSGITARKLENQADILGINTEELQRYAYAAKIAAGTTEEDFAGALGTLGDTLNEVRRGNIEAGAALNSLGALADKSKEIQEAFKNPKTTALDLFKIIQPGFNQITDAVTRARLATQIFGNNALIPLLKMAPEKMEALAREGDRVAVTSEKQTAAAKALWQQYVKLGESFEKVSRGIGFTFMQVARPYLDMLLKWVATHQQLIRLNVAQAFKALAEILPVAVEAGKDFFHGLSAIVEKLGGTKNALKDLFAAYLIFKGVQLGTGLVQLGVAIVALGPQIPILLATAFALHEIWAALTGIENSYIFKALHNGGGATLGKLLTPTVLGANDMIEPGEKYKNYVPTAAEKAAEDSAHAREQAHEASMHAFDAGKTVNNNYQPILNIQMGSKATVAETVDATSKMLERDKELYLTKISNLYGGPQ
jgi:hypothetical protein